MHPRSPPRLPRLFASASCLLVASENWWTLSRPRRPILRRVGFLTSPKLAGGPPVPTGNQVEVVRGHASFRGRDDRHFAKPRLDFRSRFYYLLRYVSPPPAIARSGAEIGSGGLESHQRRPAYETGLNLILPAISKSTGFSRPKISRTRARCQLPSSPRSSDAFCSSH